jgi:hypothetical protein
MENSFKVLMVSISTRLCSEAKSYNALQLLVYYFDL